MPTPLRPERCVCTPRTAITALLIDNDIADTRTPYDRDLSNGNTLVIGGVLCATIAAANIGLLFALANDLDESDTLMLGAAGITTAVTGGVLTILGVSKQGKARRELAEYDASH